MKVQAAGIVGPLLLKWAMDGLQAMPEHMYKQSPNLIIGALLLSAMSKVLHKFLPNLFYQSVNKVNVLFLQYVGLAWLYSCYVSQILHLTVVLAVLETHFSQIPSLDCVISMTMFPPEAIRPYSVDYCSF